VIRRKLARDEVLSALAGAAGHPLLEVRQRALRSLQFKLQNGLLPPDALARDAPLLAALLSWFQHDTDEASMAVALEMLSAMARNTAVAAQLLALGADQMVLGLRLPAYLTGLADQLLADMYSSRRAQDPPGSSGAVACYTVPVSTEELSSAEAALALPYLPSEPGVCWSPPRKISPPTSSPEAVSWGSSRAAPGPDATSSVVSRVFGQGSSHTDALAQHGLHVKDMQLSGEDRKQLEDLVLQLAHSNDEASVHMALLQLQAGALADVPVEGILAGTDIVPALLQLVASGASSTLPGPALACIHQLVRSIAAAVDNAATSSGRPAGLATTPIAPTTHSLLLACCAALNDIQLHHITIPLLADLVLLTRPACPFLTNSAKAAFCCSWRQALGAVADALHLAMVRRAAACSYDFDLLPPTANSTLHFVKWQHCMCFFPV
jgi:hypothetical protein